MNPGHNQFSSPSTNSNVTSTFAPPVIHIIEGILKDLKFLNVYGHLTNSDYESIIKKLPTSYEPHAAPHTPPGPSPISSPLTEPHILPGTSSKENSKNSSPKIMSQEHALRALSHEGHQSPQQSQISPSQSSPYLPLYQQPSAPSPTHNHQHPSDIQVNNNIDTPIYEHNPRVLPQVPGATNPPQPIEPPIVNPKQEEAEQYKEQESECLPRYSNSNELLEALWDFGGDDDGDLNFKKGDIIEVIEHVNDDWWNGRVQGRSEIGIFPRVYTKAMTTEMTSMNNMPQQIAAPHQPVASQVQPQQFIPPFQQGFHQQMPTQTEYYS